MGVMYPTAMYFFVNKSNLPLAKLITDGLEKAIESGKVDALFMRIHQSILDKSNMQKRRFYILNNPLLPKNTPLTRKALWYKPTP